MFQPQALSSYALTCALLRVLPSHFLQAEALDVRSPDSTPHILCMHGRFVVLRVHTNIMGSRGYLVLRHAIMAQGTLECNIVLLIKSIARVRNALARPLLSHAMFPEHNFNNLHFIISLEANSITTCAAEQPLMFPVFDPRAFGFFVTLGRRLRFWLRLDREFRDAVFEDVGFEYDI